MGRVVAGAAVLMVVAHGVGVAQPAPAPPGAAALVRQWIDRVNALSDQSATLDAFVALFAPDALLTTGPTADQRGTVTYRGASGLRTFATRLAAREHDRSYRLETETARETTASLLHEASGPWGGPAVAVQIVAAYTDAATGTRYVVPGAAFFQVSGGTIRRLRLYFGDGERAEVEPQPKKKP